jgi:adenosylmethionine-8-amino-7-oxononanoate aminotransferase
VSNSRFCYEKLDLGKGLANDSAITVRVTPYGHVLSEQDASKSTLDKLRDLPLVGDVRGTGFFYGIELAKDKEAKTSFTAEESERILKGYVSTTLFDNGLYCRADDRAEPVVQLAPPLICEQAHFDEMEQIIRHALEGAWKLI